MTALLIIIGVSLLVFSIWNLIQLKGLKKNSSKKNEQLNDAKYYELKYKSEFIVAIFSVIVAATGILGYNSLTSAKNEIKNDLLKKTRSIDSIIKIAENKIKTNDSILTNIEIKQNLLNGSIPLTEKKILNQNYQIDLIQKMISELNQTNKIKQSFYLIKNLSLKNKSPHLKTFEFQNLKTNIGDNLPIFSKNPFIIPIPETPASIEIYDITLEGFSVMINSWTSLEDQNINGPEEFKFSIMVIENK